MAPWSSILLMLLATVPMLAGQKRVDCGGERTRLFSICYTIRNALRPPFFEHSLQMRLQRWSDPFIRYMETAVDSSPLFRNFTTTYHKKWKYFVNSINGLEGNWTHDNTFWAFLDSSDQPLPVGVSWYKPKPRDHLTLNFTDVWPH